MASFSKLTAWFTHVTLRFISYLVSPPLTDSSILGSDSDYLWRDKIQKKLAVHFTQLCMKEFITLIQEFPESTPCLEDLKRALGMSQMNDQFVAQVIQQL